MRTVPTTTRSRKHEQRHPEPMVRFTITEIANAAGRDTEAVALLLCKAERNFRAVWELWETVGFDESRIGEIRTRLDVLEKNI